MSKDKCFLTSTDTDGAGGIPTPAPGTLADNEMLKANTGGTEIVGTGDTNTDTEVDFGSKDVKCKTIITESASVDIGEGLTLSDRGGDLVNTSNVTGDAYIPIESKIVKTTGSEHPVWGEREAEVIKDIVQGNDTQSMIGITGYTVVPTTNEDISRVYTKFINPVTDFRARVTSSATGEIVKYIPSRNDFDKGTGLSLGAGEQFFEIAGSLREEVGTTLTVEVFANESIDVLGDGTNPWRAVDRNPINVEKMAIERDLAMESISTALIEGGVITADTTTTVNIAAGKGRIVTIDTQGVPTIVPVSWDEKLAVPITNIATQSGTRIAIDVNGDVVELSVLATAQTNRDYINIGVVAHAAGIVGRFDKRITRLENEFDSFVNKLPFFKKEDK